MTEAYLVYYKFTYEPAYEPEGSGELEIKSVSFEIYVLVIYTTNTEIYNFLVFFGIVWMYFNLFQIPLYYKQRDFLWRYQT